MSQWERKDCNKEGKKKSFDPIYLIDSSYFTVIIIILKRPVKLADI